MKINALVAIDELEPLRSEKILLRELQKYDVKIEVLYCGVCHSDLHMVRNEWAVSQYPLVPGHEIVGRVVDIGEYVTHFKRGEIVGVGVMVDSCRECDFCKHHEEQYCETGFTATYNGIDRYTGDSTKGGYAQNVIVDHNFVVSIPQNLSLAGVAPLLCAGVTVWSPLRYFNINAGDRVGVVGLGGLGHMAVKLANAMGAEVTLFTTSPEKGKDAFQLGAKKVVISSDAEQMTASRTSLDFIIDCVAAPHDLDPYLATLKTNGRLVLVGIPDQPHKSPNITPMVFRRLSISGSSIGSIQETQEMLNFCGEHNITADIEMINGEDIETAFSRMLKGDVKYRFVIDMKATNW